MLFPTLRNLCVIANGYENEDDFLFATFIFSLLSVLCLCKH